MDLNEKISYISKNSSYLNENSIKFLISNYISRLLSNSNPINILRSNWLELKKLIETSKNKKEIESRIEKVFPKFKLVNEISAKKDEEGFLNWLKSMIFQLQGSLAIFSGLQIFFSIDPLLEGGNINMKKLLIYSFLWLLLSSNLYKQWKRGEV